MSESSACFSPKGTHSLTLIQPLSLSLLQGSLCETEVNECDSNPCSNGGTCVDHFDGYTCQCVTGFRGTNCLIEDKCASNPCQNGGSCEEGQNQVLDLTIMLDNSGSLTDTDIVAIKNATVEMVLFLGGCDSVCDRQLFSQISTLGDDDRCALYTFGDSSKNHC